MATYLYPGFKDKEISVFPPLVEEVESAFPGFIGYTAKATLKEANDLILVPTRIHSMKEFDIPFGPPYENQIEITVTKDSSNKYFLSCLSEPALQYLLYFSVSSYFENGGKTCYILSVGTYQTPQQVFLEKGPESQNFGLLDGLNKLADVGGITLIVIPEAVKLQVKDYSLLVQATLKQCYQLGNRFAIFDLYHGENCDPDLSLDRSFFGNNYLGYGAVYYPFVRTVETSYVNPEKTNVSVTHTDKAANLCELKITNTPLYKFIKTELKKRHVVLPASGAVAGAYVTTDKNRGVWKSPSNLSLAGMSKPVVHIDNRLLNLLQADQDSGKSINCIRFIPNKKPLVWGARTLAGNDNEWQYVPVSRFIIMVKESLRKSTCWVVFEPNNESTWSKVRLMIRNYLTLKWQEGALAGITPQQAFFVNCGFGTTMTTQDISEGKMNIEVGMAMLCPTEFATLRFSHQLNSSILKIC
jgi:phage tail sheath protein FI